MPSKQQILSEAYKRGILPEDKKIAYEEAVRRGLIPNDVSKENLSFGDKLIIGSGRGFKDVYEGVKQAGGRIGEGAAKTILRLKGERVLPEGQSPIDEYTRKVQEEREFYEQTPVGRSTSGQVGRFAGNVSPFIVAPAGASGNLLERAAVGAASGAAIGATNFVPEDGSRLANTITGGVIGGAIAPAIAGIASLPAMAIRGLFRGGKGGRERVSKAVESFEKAGLTPSVGQATRNKMIYGAENTVARLPGGGYMGEFAEQSAEKMGEQVNKIADRLSKKRGAEIAGITIQKGISGPGGFVDRFTSQSSYLYDKLDKFIPKQTPVSITNTQSLLTDLTRPIQGAENVSQLLSSDKVNSLLGALTKDAVDGKVPYEALKGIRSKVGRELNKSELVSDFPRAELKRIYGALTEDMRAAAKQLDMAKKSILVDRAGKAILGGKGKAELAFDRANNFTRAGHNRIDDFLQNLSNKVEPEDVFVSATRGKEGATRIRSVMRSLTPKEKDIVTSSVIRRIGKAKPGVQDELGETFSVSTFLTNWNTLSPEAKKALFSSPSYKGLSDDLDNIASVSTSIREGSKVLANPSGTGEATANIVALSSGATAAVLGQWHVPLFIAVGSVSNRAAAKLLTNPEFVRFLSRTTKLPSSKSYNALLNLVRIHDHSDSDTQEAIEEYLNAIKETAGTAPQQEK